MILLLHLSKKTNNVSDIYYHPYDKIDISIIH